MTGQMASLPCPWDDDAKRGTGASLGLGGAKLPPTENLSQMRRPRRTPEMLCPLQFRSRTGNEQGVKGG